MAHFYRDTFVSNVTVDEDVLRQLNTAFESRENNLNANIPQGQAATKRAFLTYIIRFDNKGYRVFTLDALLTYFQQAKKIERIIFAVETGESLSTNRKIGTHLELCLDVEDPNKCYISATSNENDWVDSSFSAVQEVIDKSRNKNRWVRTVWTQLGVQIIGVTIGFIFSLWVAIQISPKIKIENSFVISFLFVLLIFSNTWTYLSKGIFSFINSVFPNIDLYRFKKDRMHWLLQTLVGGIVVAIVIYILSVAVSYFGDMLGELIEKGA